ncbi:MAG TPA: hypothetical protein VK844_04080 [Hyphomicrobiales bacterium]|nr:hypothetical protein [Hyphomicrobiales bacterium]
MADKDARAGETAGGQEQVATAQGPGRRGRQAVIVIHGMGEQRPMDTLRGFVRAVWERDPSLVPDRPEDDRESQVWSKPDAPGESFELRRLTTRTSKGPAKGEPGMRTDFYEFYWAHLMSGTAWEHFSEWLQGLLFRRWSQVPPDVRHAWLLLWVAAIVVAIFALATVIPDDAIFWQWPVLRWVAALPKWANGAITVLAGLAVHKFLLPYFGDVARYVTAAPHNIARRNAIRSAGVKMLEAVNDPDRYHRVVVFAHSLGTLVAYDILSIFWARHNRRHEALARRPEQPALQRLSEMAVAAHKGEPPDLETYRATQRELFDELRELGNPWLITDFVTVGSPLTHAEFLLAKDHAELDRKIEQRELPTAPPYPELGNDGKRAIAYGPPRPFAGRIAMRTLHHAAMFAPMRWTNIYDPHRLILFGDIISGPCRQELGPGVKDVAVRIKGRRGRLFTHTEYWWWDDDRHAVDDPPEHIKVLREALNLLDRRPPAAGGERAAGEGAKRAETAPKA